MRASRVSVFALVLASALAVAACGTASLPTQPSVLGGAGTAAAPARPSLTLSDGAGVAGGAGGAGGVARLVDGIAQLEEFEVCKVYSGTIGPAVTINVTVDLDANGSIDIANPLVLADGQCAIAHRYQQANSNDGRQIQRVTVTEQVPNGYSSSYVLTQWPGTTPGPSIAGNSASGDMLSNPDNGFLVVFTNTADPVSLGTGRFTGGGLIEVGAARITGGLTIHCDLLLSNNLEVNWLRNRFHMTEHLATVACSDDPNIGQAPPQAPLDTLVGVGTGRYNGEDGYTIEFTLVDAGEPGRDDRIALRIYETANPANEVLNIPLRLLDRGNLQAHYDQPHK